MKYKLTVDDYYESEVPYDLEMVIELMEHYLRMGIKVQAEPFTEPRKFRKPLKFTTEFATAEFAIN